MSTLNVKLSHPIKRGSKRSLTKSECNFIRNQRTSVMPYPGKCWSLVRDDDHNLSLRWDSKKDGGASWAILEVTL